jgi:hypothetical protein
MIVFKKLMNSSDILGAYVTEYHLFRKGLHSLNSVCAYLNLTLSKDVRAGTLRAHGKNRLLFRSYQSIENVGDAWFGFLFDG